MGSHIFLFLLVIGGLVFIICSVNEFIESFHEYGIPAYVFFIPAFLVGAFLGGRETLPFLRDFKNLKNKNFEVVTGKVIGFKKNLDVESGVQINGFPKIMTENSELIILSVNEVLEKDTTYTIIYLKNSKIAITKE